MADAKMIFTKTQAITFLIQIKEGSRDPDWYRAVDPNHSLYKNTCEELESKLSNHVRKEALAGVVDDPIIHKPKT